MVKVHFINGEQKTLLRQLAEASACNPIDFVSAAGVVSVHEVLLAILNLLI
jgi:hypothetical protein